MYKDIAVQVISLIYVFILSLIYFLKFSLFLNRFSLYSLSRILYASSGFDSIILFNNWKYSFAIDSDVTLTLGIWLFTFFSIFTFSTFISFILSYFLLIGSIEKQLLASSKFTMIYLYPTNLFSIFCKNFFNFRI